MGQSRDTYFTMATEAILICRERQSKKIWTSTSATTVECCLVLTFIVEAVPMKARPRGSNDNEGGLSLGSLEEVEDQWPAVLDIGFTALKLRVVK